MKYQIIQKRLVRGAYECIGRVWCVEILSDMLDGKKRFTDFLDANPALSTKMLSQRLVEMQKNGLIRKKYNAKTHGHDYVLLEKGRKARKILVEMEEFSKWVIN